MVTRFKFLFYFKLAKNADPDKCVFSGYGIGFDLHYLKVAWAKMSLCLELI